MDTEVKPLSELKIRHYTDGCDEVWGGFEVDGRHPLFEFRFWDNGDGVKRREFEEKARLLGAAPEMLLALLLAEKCFGGHSERTSERQYVLRRVRAAIERAMRCVSSIPESASTNARLRRVVHAVGDLLAHHFVDEAQDFEAANEDGKEKYIARYHQVLEEWRNELLKEDVEDGEVSGNV